MVNTRVWIRVSKHGNFPPNVFLNNYCGYFIKEIPNGLPNANKNINNDARSIKFSLAKERKPVALQKTVRKPQFVERLKHTDVSEGDEAVFTIRLSGEPEVEWYHDNNLLVSDARVELEAQSDDIFRLRIKDTKLEDAGRYKCVAKNRAGESTCAVSLRVKEAFIPPEFSRLSEDVLFDVDEDDDVTFSTLVKGKPEPKITWFKDGVRLRGDARFKSEKNGDEHSLTITRASALDSGKYKCAGTSPAGTSSIEFELEVKGKNETSSDYDFKYNIFYNV